MPEKVGKWSAEEDVLIMVIPPREDITEPIRLAYKKFANVTIEELMTHVSPAMKSKRGTAGREANASKAKKARTSAEDKDDKEELVVEKDES